MDKLRGNLIIVNRMNFSQYDLIRSGNFFLSKMCIFFLRGVSNQLFYLAFLVLLAELRYNMRQGSNGRLENPNKLSTRNTAKKGNEIINGTRQTISLTFEVN